MQRVNLFIPQFRANILAVVVGRAAVDTIVKTVNVVNDQFAETLPDQVVRSPKKVNRNVRPLEELTVEEVGVLLSSCKLSKFVDEMKDNDVDGPTLMEISHEDELKELGISITVKARMFHKKVEVFKYDGVPLELLGESVKEEQQTSENNDVPTQYGDGSFSIAGATGNCAARINGTYEISDEMQNGLPVYCKVGDSDTFIELVHGAVGWRWYLKPAKEKGPNNSVCFAYAQCKDEDMKLPSETIGSEWRVHANGEFASQSTVVITPTSNLPLPANIAQLLHQARITIKAAKEALIAEVCNFLVTANFSSCNQTYLKFSKSETLSLDLSDWKVLLEKVSKGSMVFLNPRRNHRTDFLFTRRKVTVRHG